MSSVHASLSTVVGAVLASDLPAWAPPLLQQGPPERLGAPWMGVVLPALMLIVSFAVTWALYRHFSTLEESSSASEEGSSAPEESSSAPEEDSRGTVPGRLEDP